MINKQVGRKRRFSSRYLFMAALFIFVSSFVINFFRESKWDGKSRYTFVVNANPIFVVSLEPRSKKGVILPVPSNAFLSVPFGYEEYPAFSVYKLGELDKRKGGGRLLSASIENTFGISVNGYVSFSSQPVNYAINQDNIQKLKKDYFSSVSIFQYLKQVIFFKTIGKTDIPLIDYMKLWLAIRNLRNDKISLISFYETNAFEEKTLPDGTLVQMPDYDLVDLVVSDNFQDRIIRSENISIIVENASGKEKLAAQFSKIIKNLGGNIIQKSTFPSIQRYNCLVIVSSEKLKKSIIVERLVRDYHCNISNKLSDNVSSDIQIILGENFTR